MKPTVIIQARMGSTRLPGKVLMPVSGKPMLWHIVERVKGARGIINVVVATSEKPDNDPIRTFCSENNIQCFSGSEADVLDRYYRAAQHYRADPIIRITGDCPFADPGLIGSLLDLYMGGNYDYVGIATGAGAIFLDGGRFPDGLDAECFGFPVLERAWKEAIEQSDREHVTPYIWRTEGLFRLGTLKSEEDHSDLRWTVDKREDFEVVSRVYESLYRQDGHFQMDEILNYFSLHPELGDLNRDFIGAEGYRELWKIDKKQS